MEREMSARRLARLEWRDYCNRVSKRLEGQKAELEVVGLDLGDHVEARWIPLYGLVYEPDADVLEIALEGIDHLITHPTDVLVEETLRGLVAIEVISADDTHQILKLREPLPLPVPLR